MDLVDENQNQNTEYYQTENDESYIGNTDENETVPPDSNEYNPVDYSEYEGEGELNLGITMDTTEDMVPEEELPKPEAALGNFIGNQEAIEKLEQTLALIQPEAMPYTDEIVALIRREGLAVLKVRRVQLTAEQSSQFYHDEYETPGFSDAVSHLYSGPILALVLSGPNAIDHWLRLIGPSSYKERSQQPKCFRARFGTPDSDIKCGLHGSASEADALRELHFFFPELVVEPIIADNLASYYLNENVHPVLTIGLSKLVREKPSDPVLWLSDWLLANNPNKPQDSRNGCQ